MVNSLRCLCEWMHGNEYGKQSVWIYVMCTSLKLVKFITQIVVCSFIPTVVWSSRWLPIARRSTVAGLEVRRDHSAALCTGRLYLHASSSRDQTCSEQPWASLKAGSLHVWAQSSELNDALQACSTHSYCLWAYRSVRWALWLCSGT